MADVKLGKYRLRAVCLCGREHDFPLDADGCFDGTAPCGYPFVKLNVDREWWRRFIALMSEGEGMVH